MDQIKQEYQQLHVPDTFYDDVIENLPQPKKRRPYLVVLPILLICFGLFYARFNYLEISYQGQIINRTHPSIYIEESELNTKWNDDLLVIELKGNHIHIDLLDSHCKIIDDNFNEINIQPTSVLKGNYYMIWDTHPLQNSKKEIIQFNSDYIEVEKVENGFKINYLGGIQK